MDKLAERIYDPYTQYLAIFKKTHEQWGEFSNMASGFPIYINNCSIRSSEALYQALKFTEYPEVQEKIISQSSPMTAKMVAKPYKHLIRSDFEDKKILIMKWSVRAKLVCNYSRFAEILLASDNRMIVEESRRDNFWGAKRQSDNKLIGVNVLGRILMELRALIQTTYIDILPPLGIPNFLLYGQPIQTLYTNQNILKNIKNQNELF